MIGENTIGNDSNFSPFSDGNKSIDMKIQDNKSDITPLAKIDKLRNFVRKKVIPALRFVNTLKNNEVKYFKPRHAKMLKDVSVNLQTLKELEKEKESKNMDLEVAKPLTKKYSI